MKKVTRLSLDELAKAMPVLTEDEQRACIGGTFYYTDDGTYLGALGPGTEIRITDADTFNIHSGFNSSAGGIGDDSDLYGTSAGIGGSSSEAKLTILNQIASGMGIGQVRLYDGPSKEYGEYNSHTGIGININSKSFQSGNYYDFIMTLYHEKFHSQQDLSRPRAEYEYETYLAVSNHSDFQLASDSYQKHVKDQIDYLKKELGGNRP